MAQGQAVEKNVEQLSEEVDEAVAAWLLENLFTPAKDFREKVVGDTNWVGLRELSTGNQWLGETPPDDFEPFQANIIMATLDTVRGIALQTPSTVEFVAPEPSDEQFCKELTAVIADYLWIARKARMKLGIAFVEGGILGTAWVKGIWNHKLNGNDGDVDFINIPTEEVWVDPTCSGADDWDYIIHAPRQAVKKVKYDENYNEYRHEVESDPEVSEGQKGDNPEDQLELVTVYEYWVRGLWLKALMEEVPEFAGKVDADGLKYGMVITVASEHVIKFRSHPYKSSRFPFPRFIYYPPTGQQMVYGRGDAEFMADIQLALNARITQMLNQAALISNNQWVVSNMVVTDEAELTNKPGQVIHVDGPPDAIKRIEPTSISTSLFNMVSLLLRLQEIIPGMYEVNRGENPGSVRAGVAIQALQRGGEGRTLQKAMNFDDFTADIAMVMADIMAEMYSEERTFRVTGSAAEDVIAGEQAQAALPPGVEEAHPDAGEAPPEMAGQMPPVDQQGMPVAPQKPNAVAHVKISREKFRKGDGEKSVDFDARVALSAQIRSADEQLMADMEMLDAGVVDAQYVIENNNLRGKERLLQRLFDVQAQEQKAMAPAAEAGMMEVPPEEDMTGPEANQVQQAVDQLLGKIQQLEAEGSVPPGFAAQVAQDVENEINNGGTGEQALARAMQNIQAQTGGMPMPM